MPDNARILDFNDFSPKTKYTPDVPKPRKSSSKHKSGLYRLHVRYQDPITGASCEKDVYGTTKAEAEKKKKDFLRKVEQGLRVARNGHTVAQWADEWLETYKAGKVKEKTYQSYESDVKRIKEYFAQCPLHSVLQRDIIDFLDTRRGLSASAIRKTAMTINAIMESAVANRLIAFNPCHGVAAPKGTEGTHRALTRDEIRVVEQVAASGHYFTRPIMLMLYAGLRRGEVAGLTADDITGDTITVCKSVEWPNNRGAVSTPKSDAGHRTIPIFSPLWPYLIDLPAGYVTTGANHKREHHVTLQAFRIGFNSFVAACAAIMPGISFRCHDLRHTFATMIYDAGVDIKTAQRWLGHADPAVTMRIYTHMSDQRKQDATSKAEKFFAAGGINGGMAKNSTRK